MSGRKIDESTPPEEDGAFHIYRVSETQTLTRGIVDQTLLEFAGINVGDVHGYNTVCMYLCGKVFETQQFPYASVGLLHDRV